MSEAKTVNLFFSHIPNSRYVFPNGQEAAFTGGRYATSQQWEIDHLNAEIAAGNLYIHTRAGQEVVTEEALDPMYEYKQRVIAEFIAKQATDPLSDKGTSEPQKLVPQSTADLGEVAGVTVAAKKIELPIK